MAAREAVDAFDAEAGASAVSPRQVSLGTRLSIELLRIGAGLLCLAGVAGVALGLFTTLLVAVALLASSPPVKDVAAYLVPFFFLPVAVSWIAVSVLCFRLGRRGRQMLKRRVAYPDTPWRWRSDWAAGRLDHTPRRMVAPAWGAALLWNAVLWGTLLPAIPARDWLSRGASGIAGLMCVSLFIVVGLALVSWAGRYTWQAWQWGKSVFELEAVPVPIGGQLAGALYTKAPAVREQHLALRLFCERARGLGGSGDLLWETAHTVGPAEQAGPSGQSTIPVRLDVPHICPPTTMRLRTHTRWRLEVRAAAIEDDYHAEFDVPVFALAEGAVDSPASEA